MATSNRARSALIASVILTVLLYIVPFGHLLAWPMVLMSTLAHELGHGLAGLLFGQHFESLVIYADASGMARHTGEGGRLARAATSAGGLLGPAFTAAALFWLGRSPKRAHYGLIALSAALLVVEALWVRNLFGLCFVAGLAGALALASRGPQRRGQLAVLFLAVQLSLSVFSRGDYLFMAEAHTGAGVFPSDTAQIAAALFLPYWFWGGVCGAISLAILAGGVFGFARD